MKVPNAARLNRERCDWGFCLLPPNGVTVKFQFVSHERMKKKEFVCTHKVGDISSTFNPSTYQGHPLKATLHCTKTIITDKGKDTEGGLYRTST